MSIAVRVSVLILGAAVFVSAAFAVWALLQNRNLQGQNQYLHHQLSDDENKLTDLDAKARKLQADEDQLNTRIAEAQQDKNQLQNQYDDLKHKSDDIQAQLVQANSDRNDWKGRVETVSRERDALMQKLRHQPVKIVYRTHVIHDASPTADTATAVMPAPAMDVASGEGDQYWATVLKQKAELQVELEKERSQLDDAALQVTDLKKQNTDLQLQVKQLSNEKDEIIQKIKYGEDLADNLSVDLARSRNDQKALDDRAEKLKDENIELQNQVRDLTSTKLDLEKTVARLTDDKDSMQKKLVETESIIQNRIDDIWKIKQGLDKKLAQDSSGNVELPPIIVNAPNQASAPAASTTTASADAAVVAAAPAPVAQQPAPVEQSAPVVASGKSEGSIISINEPNNFVIVDMGQENSTLAIGTPLKVYRGDDAIASLDVIQVRRDISAADIKDKSTELRVGDVVRLN